MVGLHSYFKKQVMLFKPKTIDEAYVQAQSLEMNKKKGHPSGPQQRDQKGDYKEEKKNLKGKGKNTIATAHLFKDPSNH
jgi:hypothetical protein